YGDENARLVVGQILKARAVLLDGNTSVSAETIEALVRCAEGWRLPQDITEDRATFAERLLDEDGDLDLEQAWSALKWGEEIFLPGAEDRLWKKKRAL